MVIFGQLDVVGRRLAQESHNQKSCFLMLAIKWPFTESSTNSCVSAPLEEKRKRFVFGWRYLLPLHFLVFAIAMSISEPLWQCSDEVAGLLTKSSEKAQVYMDQHHIDFDRDLDTFRQGRMDWHVGFDSLLAEVARDYKSLVSDEEYSGTCQTRYPIIIFVANMSFLLALVCTFGYFIFQDATTSFGASQREIYIALNAFCLFITILAVFTYPAVNLLHVAVKLSAALEDCVLGLKALQRRVIGQHMDLDLYNLHATIWDGVTFGVREPVFNYVVNKHFEDWLVRRIAVLVGVSLWIVAYLVLRSNVKSLLQWRKAIPSVVCIGVTFPGSRDPLKLWRVGSGCIVSSSRGLILTNWHLFQRMGVDQEEEPMRIDDIWSVGSGGGAMRNGHRHANSPLAFNYHPQSSSEDAMDATTNRHHHESLWRQVSESTTESTLSPTATTTRALEEEEDDDDEVDKYGVPLSDKRHQMPNHSRSAPAMMQQPKTNTATTTPNNKANMLHQAVHRHLVHSNQYAESLQETYPEMKIYIGTATRGHPHWQYEAEFTSVESPSSEFTPFGLDLLLLKITKKVGFQGLNFSESGPSASESMHAFTYSFESINTVQEGEQFDLRRENMVKLEIGNPFKLFPTDKLRLLGFPASGGYSLSVLTTYFTSMSFDYPSNQRGAWVNVNTQLPSGGSGGAAVNGQGQLVGISTQTKGELTNIRSITEAKHLIHKAKREVDRERALKEKKRTSLISPGGISCSEKCRIGHSLFI